MTIPEFNTLFLLSVCGLSVLCAGFVGVLLLGVVQLATGALGGVIGFDLLGEIPEMLGLVNDSRDEKTETPRRAATREDLRARAQNYNWDSALDPDGQPSQALQESRRQALRQRPDPLDTAAPPPRQLSARERLEARRNQQQDADPRQQDNPQPPAKPETLGDYLDQRPSSRERLQARMRDMDLQPPGDLSDNPDVTNPPPKPDFNPGGDVPNINSNINGRVGRHNTGRGQEGQRNDANLDGDNLDGLGNYVSRRNDQDRRVNRNRDIYSDGGRFDVDGDGDIDA